MAASLFLHVLIAAFLFFGLPRPDQQPDQQEQPVNVAIVPPPDQPKPKPAPKPPEPKPEKPPEQKVEKPPPPEPPKPKDLPVLKPVFQYGKKDTGPEKSLDGGSAQAETTSPQARDEAAKPPVEPKPAPNPSANPVQEASKTDEKAETAQSDAKPTPSEEQSTADADKQQQDKQGAVPQITDRQAVVAPKPLETQTDSKPSPSSSAEKAKARPAKSMQFKPATAFKAPSRNARRSNPANTDFGGAPVYAGLPGVRKLYSQGATGDAFATSSMESVPRSKRVATLCGSVLDRELQSADYAPKWVPNIELEAGNVLDPPQAAFSTRTQWYDLSFRCKVDADATRVLSFSFRVGALVPPGEWPARGFTKYPLN